jgi:hypothetical protein
MDRKDTTFAGTALRLGGKSDEEVRRMGMVDKSDGTADDIPGEEVINAIKSVPCHY